MGVFYEQCEVINRTSKRLSVRFDGQDMELDPNYSEEGEFFEDVHNMIPVVAVDYAKSQNVQMGSESPTDPSSFEVLIGRKAKRGQKQVDPIEFCEQTTELTRVKLEDYLDDPSVKIRVGGRARVSSGDARPVRDTAPFEPRG